MNCIISYPCDIYQNISYKVILSFAKKIALNRLSYIYFTGVPIEVRDNTTHISILPLKFLNSFVSADYRSGS